MCVNPLELYREPKNGKYVIRIDIFEVSGTTYLGEEIVININLGKYNIASHNCKIKKENLKKK